jgi:hypothetical protein
VKKVPGVASRWTEGWTNRWTNEWTDELNRRTDGLQSGALEGLRVWTDGASVRAWDGRAPRPFDGWACGRMGCPIKRTIDGGQQEHQGDGRMGGALTQGRR